MKTIRVNQSSSVFFLNRLSLNNQILLNSKGHYKSISENFTDLADVSKSTLKQKNVKQNIPITLSW